MSQNPKTQFVYELAVHKPPTSRHTPSEQFVYELAVHKPPTSRHAASKQFVYELRFSKKRPPRSRPRHLRERSTPHRWSSRSIQSRARHMRERSTPQGAPHLSNSVWPEPALWIAITEGRGWGPAPRGASPDQANAPRQGVRSPRMRRARPPQRPSASDRFRKAVVPRTPGLAIGLGPIADLD